MALTGFGDRTTGNTANEVHATRYLLQVLADFQSDLAGCPQSDQLELQVELQRPSGSFDLAFLNGFTSSYANVTNIIARLAPRGWAPNGDASTNGEPVHGADASLLVSGRFNSAPGTEAATHDVDTQHLPETRRCE